MDYPQFFASLLSQLRAADFSPRLIARVQLIACAPIWDDRKALECIADWSQRLVDAEPECTNATLDDMRSQALAELRGEVVQLALMGELKSRDTDLVRSALAG